jgi:anti-sigma B factor antagonist
VSSTEWTPAVPGHTNEIRRPAGPADPAGPQSAGADDPAAEQVINLDVETVGDGVLTVRVDGDVDTLTSPLLSSFLSDQFQTNPRVLVLDLTRVQFLGSAGLAVLVSAREEAGRRDVKLRLVSSSHAVLRPLTATGLASEFDTYSALEDALA